MIRLLELDDETGTLSVVGSTGRRPLSADEVENMRDALPAPRMSIGLELGAVVGGMIALSYVALKIYGGH